MQTEWPEGMVQHIRSMIPPMEDLLSADMGGWGPVANLPAIYVHLALVRIEVLEKQLTLATMHRDIGRAPRDGSWFLACDQSAFTAQNRLSAPWIIAFGDEQGYFDADGYPIAPTTWLPLPDPQPAQIAPPGDAGDDEAALKALTRERGATVVRFEDAIRGRLARSGVPITKGPSE